MKIGEYRLILKQAFKIILYYGKNNNDTKIWHDRFQKGSRMKKLLLCLPLIVGSTIINTTPSEHIIKLESPVIKVADGSFINADKIEFMRKVRRILLSIILGEQLPNGQRTGDGIQHLAYLEHELDQELDVKERMAKKEQMRKMLIEEKERFSILLGEFIESGRGAKKILIELIQEDCAKRNRSDSFLLDWAKTKEGLEPAAFDNHIQSFNDYYHFCTDLANFLLDMIHSCPKAEKQFRDRVTKWNAVKHILPLVIKKAHIKAEALDEIKFLKYLKERYLDKIMLEEITPQVILPLLMEYIKHTNNA